MRKKALLVTALVAAAGLGAGVTLLAQPGAVVRAAAPALPTDLPTAAPIDAARVQTGRLAYTTMPEEVTTALELHTKEIVHTTELLETKQARISGTCPPGAAIRVVGEDGSVVCQKLPRGVVSVSALSGFPRLSTTGTAQASVRGGVGRYETAGEDDFLVVPITLPDGATLTGFTYVFWDNDARVDGAAYLWRSDDTMLAQVRTEGGEDQVRMVTTEDVQGKRVDNSAHAYMVFMQLSAAAGPAFMPISASVSYKLP
jgi:hypothetical protein